MAKPKFDISEDTINKIKQAEDSCNEFLQRRNEFVKNACKKTTPFVVKCLLESYSNSGIKTKSGELKRAIQAAVFIPTRKGFRVTLGPGFSTNAYAKFGALQFGYIKGQVVRGSRARKKLKNLAAKDYEKTGNRSGLGGTYVEPHKYFELTDNQIAAINTEFNKHLATEVDKFFNE